MPSFITANRSRALATPNRVNTLRPGSGGTMKQSVFVLIGAVAGGLVGYFGFLWIARQGFYALVLPGGLLGIGASLSPNRSTASCITCGVLALALGLLAEWQFAPFIKNGSL